MNRSQRFGLVLTPMEKDALNRLAEAEGRLSKAATVRRLILREAQKRGLLSDYADQPTVSEMEVVQHG